MARNVGSVSIRIRGRAPAPIGAVSNFASNCHHGFFDATFATFTRSWVSSALPMLLLCLPMVVHGVTVASVLSTLYPSGAAYERRRVEARNAALAASTLTSSVGIPLAGDASTYGEFDLEFFTRLLKLAAPQQRETFVDLGSGVGRLVMGAALLYPNTFANCHGMELSAPLHERAIEARYAFESFDAPLPNIAPCEYTCCDCFSLEAATALVSTNVCFS